jgi:hypothetical protein
MTSLQPYRRGGIREYPLLDEMVLYFPEKEAAFSLNSSAKVIWELCDGRRTLADICRDLGGRLGCPADYLVADVEDAVGRLRTLGLLEVEDRDRVTPH